MATVTIRIENGFFVNACGRYIESVKPTHVVANGWDCIIRKDGSIECDSVREYSDGKHSVRYAIQKNGFAKLTLKRPGEKIQTLKKGFVISKGHKLLDGTLGLSGGNIDTRYAFFRDSSFQKFLEEHNISSVQKEDPNNRFFTLRTANYGGGDCRSSILTDGIVHSVKISYGRTDQWEQDFPFTCSYEREELVSVEGATWVIHKQSQHEGNRNSCFKILYTLENPTTLVGIPNVEEH